MSKFLNVDDTVDLIKSGVQNAALQDFEDINDADSKILIKIINANETVRLSFIPLINDNKIINWGDGTTTTYTCIANTELTAEHTYNKTGYYIIRIPHIANPGSTSIGVNAYDSIKDFNFIIPQTAPIKVIWTIAPGYNSTESSFGINAFGYCANLEKVILDERWASRYNRNTTFCIYSNAFRYCKSLTNVKIYKYEDTADYFSNKITLKIYANAFKYCVNLKCIDEINNSELLGGENFSYCKQLPLWDKIVYSSDNIANTISQGAWYKMLNYNVYKDTLTIVANTIPLNSFLFDSDFTGNVNKLFITLPNSFSSVNLQFVRQEIHITNTTPPTVSSQVRISSHIKIFVPSSAVDAYKAASGWSTYADRIFAETSTYLYTELDNKLSTTGGALTGDVTTSNTTFTNTSLVTKQYVDDTIAALDGNNIQY